MRRSLEKAVRGRLARAAAAFLVAAATSCVGGSQAMRPAGGGMGGVIAAGGAGGSAGMPADPEPVFTAEARAALKTLAPPTLPGPPPDVTNKYADNPDAARLGQRFFFEPTFSGELLDGDNDGTNFALGKKGETGKVACAGCHVPDSAFVDSRTVNGQISLGAGWGQRRSPSLLDVAQSRLVMWDGRRDALYNQVFGPIESAVEMNSSRLYGAQQIFAKYRADYEAVFGPMPPLGDSKRFPAVAANAVGCRALDGNNQCTTKLRGVPGDGAEFDGMTKDDQDAVTRVWVNLGKAITAYERLLTCGASRFDKWVNGDATALNRSEQRGAGLFVGKAKCVSCHSGAFFSDEKFHNVGLKPTTVATVFLDADDPGASVGLALAKMDPLNVKGLFSDGDDGRLPETIDEALLGSFRTPRLRCGSRHPSFMHTGQLRSLDEVVAFFVRGGDEFGYPGKSELTKTDLTVQDRADLVAFLKALEGPGPDAKLRKAP
jgi:cytochrome c peroxidase